MNKKTSSKLLVTVLSFLTIACFGLGFTAVASDADHVAATSKAIKNYRVTQQYTQEYTQVK